MAKNRWIALRARASKPRLRLYCFPYAGRGASMYATWGQLFGSDVEVCPVQLPGREDRLHEPAARRMEALATGFLAEVGHELTTPFAFFGHSLGGLVAFEIARRLQTESAAKPERLFVSASHPPDASLEPKQLYKLPDARLVDELRSWNGTPESVLRDPELLKIVLPIIRADLELLDHYAVADAAMLDCPIIAFGGKRDRELPLKLLARWRDRTRSPFNVHMFDGDHFFIGNAARPMQIIITAELAKILAALPAPETVPVRLVG